MKSNATLLKLGAFLGASGVSLGAFGAHALAAQLATTGRTDTYETAVLYHLIHALAILIAVLLSKEFSQKWSKIAGFSFTGGVFIFSGSLYLLCFTGITWLGAITPIGGVLFIFGWVSLFLAATRNKKTR